MDITFFESASDLEAWLEEHHDTAKELHVGFYKTSASKSRITYAEAVDLALRFGWIDGVRRRVDDDRYTNRFTPRKPKSNWSNVNIKRANELIDLGLMRPAGLKAFEARDQQKSGQYSFENGDPKLSDTYAEQFRANEPAWEFFQSQAPSYQRTVSWWVMSAKHEETRQRRLAALIESSANRRRLSQFVSPGRRDANKRND